MSIPQEGVETYIGDGVYASHDGYQIWLRTGRESGLPDERIALDPGTYASLEAYAERLFGLPKRGARGG